MPNHREIRNGFTQYRSGETVTVPTDGRPYQMRCGDTVYSLHHTVDDSGNVRMQVHVDPGETERLRQPEDAHANPRDPTWMTNTEPRRATPMSPGDRYATDDDGEIFDEHGIIRDGKKFRVPAQLMDSAPRRLAPLVITTGLRLDKEFFLDGTRKSEFLDRTSPPRGARARKPVPQSVADAAVAAALADANNPHKPGWRGLDWRTADAAPTNDVTDAYNDYVSRLQDEWKSPERRAQDLRDAQRVDPPPPDGTWTPAQWARELTTREIVADSMRPSPGTWWGDGENTQAPQGIWPVGGTPVHLTNAKENDQCCVDGGIGHLVNRDGVLFCELAPMAQPRVPSSNPSTDSVPRTMDAATAQRIKDEAWNAYVQDISNAWRPQE
jgi:hypothetical protein